MSTLYHTEIFLPEVLRALGKKTLAPAITAHAKEAALSDRYGKIELPASVTFSGREIVEAEIDGGAVVKLVVRVAYDATRDLVLAIGFRGADSFIKTAWFNLKSDLHSTLDRSRYATR